MAEYIAKDSIDHNGTRYAAGAALDMDDFSKNQLVALLAAGVIEAVADDGDFDIGDDVGADSSVQATEADEPVSEKSKKKA